MTEPTRDLVDREELRRILVGLLPELDRDRWDKGCRSGVCTSIAHLDVMPSVECPRGWTRDEVLHELDTHPGAACEWLSFTGKWVEVARREIENWHPEVRRYDVRVVLPEPPVTVWVPLTKLVGRTMVCRTKPVEATELRFSVYPPHGLEWLAPNGYWVEVHLDESGCVEVLAEGDA